MRRLHADEVDIDAGLARRLVDRSFPEFADYPLRAAGESGSSNALFRLGSDLLVRMPRQPGGGASIEKEARWLPFVRRRLSADVPEVVGIGEPAFGYSERWAVTSWIDGRAPVPASATSAGGGPVALARDLARLLTELREMEIPAGAAGDDSLTWYRGEPVAALDEDFRGAVVACRNLQVDLDLDDALRTWDAAVVASGAADPCEAWYHGDLLAENLLIDEEGRLRAVLDFGGLAIGNPTVDLVVAWELLDAEGRQVFRRALDLDDAAWAASRGWALLIAMITFPYYGGSMPRRCADRLVMAQAALATG